VTLVGHHDLVFASHGDADVLGHTVATTLFPAIVKELLNRLGLVPGVAGWPAVLAQSDAGAPKVRGSSARLGRSVATPMQEHWR
jgi:hypothetical protein